MKIVKEVSRQRLWQRERPALGLCMFCAKKAVNKLYCEFHRVKINNRRKERYHKKTGSKIFYKKDK